MYNGTWRGRFQSPTGTGIPKSGKIKTSTNESRSWKGDDVLKGLDDIVVERRIQKPVNKFKRKFGDDADADDDRSGAVVNGQRRGSTSSCSSSSSSSFSVGKRVSCGLDPRNTSLDDVVVHLGITRDGTIPDKPVVAPKADDEVVDRDVSNVRRNDHEEVERKRLSINCNLEGPRRGARTNNMDRLTAYRAVGFLVEKGLEVQVKLGKLKERAAGERKNWWRCEMRFGFIDGVAESERMVVAREFACREFLRLLHTCFPEGEIPPYNLPPEICYDPNIVSRIEGLAKSLKVNYKYDVRLAPCLNLQTKKTIQNCFYVTYDFVGGAAEGFDPRKKYAKIHAALDLYQFLTKQKHPMTPLYYGRSKHSDDEFEFVVTQLTKMPTEDEEEME